MEVNEIRDVFNLLLQSMKILGALFVFGIDFGNGFCTPHTCAFNIKQECVYLFVQG